VGDFLAGLQRWFKDVPEDPAKWTFGGLTREKDGRFQDSDLIGLLQKGTENVAGKFLVRPLQLSGKSKLADIS